jgi:cytochrome c biogenesis protein CcmG/thiol:disulfide interchange protein DsbE
MKRVFLIPLVLFGLLALFLALGLQHDPHEVPSPLIGKPAPDINLPQLAVDGGAASPVMFNSKQMRGQVWLLNVWASWCESCREEHPLLLDFARKVSVPLIGLDYKDKDEDARRWLAQSGNPYQLAAVDADGRVGIDYGVYGVPETYVIDKAGIIRYKQIGPLTAEVLQSKILPLIAELQQ